jgi:hypothetical protein
VNALKRLSCPAFLVLALLTFAGCATFERRAKEKAAVFAALDAPTQARLRDGRVEIGDTLDMAYLALGTPGETRDQTTADGIALVWIYHRRWQEYRGEAVVGYQPVPTTDPKTGLPATVYAPVHRSLYQDREEERLRLTFKDGKLAVIERPKW